MSHPAACEILELDARDASELSAMFLRARPEYIEHFHPFAFDEESVRGQLATARRDKFWALRCAGELAGFFMLRGFDAGYARPSFGVFVDEKFSGRGLATRALEHALAWCRQEKIAEVMLKAHPDNEFARRAYKKAGFVEASVCDKSGHTIFVKRLPS